MIQHRDPRHNFRDGNCGGDGKKILEAAGYATGGAGAGAVLVTELGIIGLTVGSGIAVGVIAGLAIYVLIEAVRDF